MIRAWRPGTDGWGALLPALLACAALALAGRALDPHLVLVVLVALWAGIAAWSPAAEDEDRSATSARSAPAPIGAAPLLVVGLAVLVLYMPPVLARHGPFGEDKYLLSAALRGLDGQRPYADFEFLYGPLLIVPVTAWFRNVGYTLTAYYWVLALVEALTFVGLWALLGRVIPEWKPRLVAFGLAALLLVNDNLGLSWIALRRLLPVVTLVVFALRGRSGRGRALVAGMLAVQLLLSVEFAAAAVLGIGAIGLLDALRSRTRAPLREAVVTGSAGLGLGLLGGVLLLGSDVTAWLGATLTVIRERGGGEAGFPFQWSVNALAVLLVLFLAAGRLGRGLGRPRELPLAAGDRLLAGGLAYAIVAMRSGLGRADMYHVVPPILGIIASGVLPLETRVFAAGRQARRAMTAAIALVALTWAPGLLGAGRLWAEGLVLGGRDLLVSAPPSPDLPARTRVPHILGGRSVNPPDLVALAEYLADPARASRPVIFYERSWGLDRMIGVAKPRGIYATDDYLVSDARGEAIWAYLRATPAALVLVDRVTWDFLAASGPAPVASSMFWIGGTRSVPVRILERWSSAHFGVAVAEEVDRKRDRWARTVGRHLPGLFAPAAEFGRWLVLERRS